MMDEKVKGRRKRWGDKHTPRVHLRYHFCPVYRKPGFSTVHLHTGKKLCSYLGHGIAEKGKMGWIVFARNPARVYIVFLRGAFLGVA